LLLDEGFEVRTTVRKLSDKEKYGHLTALAIKSKGVLRVFEADLLKQGSFLEAMKDCELIIHTASPFMISGVKDSQKQLIEPALEGTRNVLNAVDSTDSVKRVVLTSSVVAVYGDAIELSTTENGRFTESCWNTTSSASHQPYSYSKTLAEKLAWELAGKQNRWDLVTINPGFIMGPSLSKRTDSTSIDVMIQMASGKFKTGVPSGNMGMVDVRDTARAHILAGFNPNASGRHICVSAEKDFLDIAEVIRRSYPEYPLPKSHAPKWLIWLIAPLIGFSRKYVQLNIGYNLKFDQSYIIKDLGIEFLPFEKTITDHFEQLLNDQIIKRK
jgi:nucleoside-diphosphate-sugar epimerase